MSPTILRLLCSIIPLRLSKSVVGALLLLARSQDPTTILMTIPRAIPTLRVDILCHEDLYLLRLLVMPSLPTPPPAN